MQPSFQSDPLLSLRPIEPGTARLHVIIETPEGSRNKYKYDPRLRLLRVSRVLPAGMSFPHNFGFIPGTCAEDGDALDVVVMGLGPAAAGCLTTARLIGVLRAWQVENGRRINNDRLLAFAETAVNRAPVRDLRTLDPQMLREIEHFFESYNCAQGRRVCIVARAGRRAAQAVLLKGIRQFAQHSSS